MTRVDVRKLQVIDSLRSPEALQSYLAAAARPQYDGFSYQRHILADAYGTESVFK